MRRLIVLAFSLLLAGCSTLGTGGPGPSGGGRALDPVNDDVGGMLVAFDLPRGLGPAPSGQLFTYDVANGGPQEHLRLTLVQADDADQVAGTLPPPSDGRAYYLFGFSDADKAKLLAAQTSARARGITAQSVKIGIVPHLCTSGQVDPNTLTVSILGGLPGQTRMMAFLDHELLASLLQQPGSTQMPACV